MAALSADEARGALVLDLRRAGVADLDLLRAIETVPREMFLPHALADLGPRNCPLPIACGQTMHSPGTIAAMISALQVNSGHRVLQIGAGAGYATAILSRLAGEVVAFERFATLAREAAGRLAALGCANVAVHHADGLEAPEAWGAFDRILIHATFGAPPPSLFGVLSATGRIVCGLEGREGERLAILSSGIAQRLAPCRLGRPLSGVARAL